MPDETSRGPSRALAYIVIGYGLWVAIVLLYTLPIAPAQRVLVAGSLLAVGALISGMGYLSTIRRRALRIRQDSLRRILEQRRREKGV